MVKRAHLGALDPVDGHALEWFVSSNSNEGDKHLEATPRGLFVGGDGNTKGGYNVGRIAFLDFNSVPAQNGTQTTITAPIEGRIEPVNTPYEITGTATAASGINRVEVEIQDRNSNRYLNDDLTTWGTTTLNTFNATLDPGTGPNRTWRLPVTMTNNRELLVPGPRGREQRHGRQHQGVEEVRDLRDRGRAADDEHHRSAEPPGPDDLHHHRQRGDDIGVNGISLTLRDTQNRYLQDDGTVSFTYNSFQITPDVVARPRPPGPTRSPCPSRTSGGRRPAPPTPVASRRSTRPTGAGS